MKYRTSVVNYKQPCFGHTIIYPEFLDILTLDWFVLEQSVSPLFCKRSPAGVLVQIVFFGSKCENSSHAPN